MVYSDLDRDEEIVFFSFFWAPSHVGIRIHSATDSATMDVLRGDISDELISFSDLKPRLKTGNMSGMNALMTNYIRSDQN